MNLYKITTDIWGKDLDESFLVEYLVRENEEQVFDYINKNYRKGRWENRVGISKEEIIAAKGDGDRIDECMEEFYGQCFGWEEVSPVTPEGVSLLKLLKIVPE